MIPATLPPEFGNVAQKKQLKLWFFALLRTFLNCKVVFRNIFVNWYEARRQVANHGSYGLVDVGVVPNLTYTLWCFHSPRLAIEENTVHLQRSEILLAALVKHLLLGITDMNPNITSHHFASMPRIHVYLKDFISAMIFPATKSLNYGIRHLFENIRLSRHVNSVAAFSGASDSGVATFWHYRKRGLLSSSFSPPPLLLLSSSPPPWFSSPSPSPPPDTWHRRADLGHDGSLHVWQAGVGQREHGHPCNTRQGTFCEVPVVDRSCQHADASWEKQKATETNLSKL